MVDILLITVVSLHSETHFPESNYNTRALVHASEKWATRTYRSSNLQTQSHASFPSSQIISCEMRFLIAATQNTSSLSNCV